MTDSEELHGCHVEAALVVVERVVGLIEELVQALHELSAWLVVGLTDELRDHCPHVLELSDVEGLTDELLGTHTLQLDAELLVVGFTSLEVVLDVH